MFVPALNTRGIQFMRALATRLLTLLVLASGLSFASADQRNVARLAPELLAARIDEIVSAKLTAKGIQPAALSDDAEFLRRLSLDLVGRIPRAFEVRDFVED